MEYLNQSDFARLMHVAPKTVSVWKTKGRIVMRGELVDVEASRLRMLKYSRPRSKALAGARALGNQPPELLPAAVPAVADGNAQRLVNDDRYAAGLVTGLDAMAASALALAAQAAADVGVSVSVAEALQRSLKAALLRRMEALMDLWGIHPFVTAADDEIDTIIARDTWVGRSWPDDALDDVYVTEDLTEASAAAP